MTPAQTLDQAVFAKSGPRFRCLDNEDIDLIIDSERSEGHAFLAPSGSPQWGPGGCPASARMQAAYPEDVESEKAREGTAAHFYVSEALLGREHPAGTVAPNGVPINAEMISCGTDYLRDIRDTMKSAPDVVLRVEQRVTMTRMISPGNWGTPDAYVVDYWNRRVHLWDYKYGHRYVDAFRCWQLIDYLIGIVETENIPDIETWTFTQTIAQPRNYHPDGPLRCAPDITGAQLVTLAEELRVAAEAALGPTSPFKTGDHCRDCTARHACPALQKVAMSCVDMSFCAQPVDLTANAQSVELAIIRAAIKRMGARAEGLEASLLGCIRSGANVPFHKAEYSFGREKWKDDTNAQDVFAVGDMFGVDLRKKQEPITPAQAKKAGVDASVIDTYAHKPRGALTLVEITEHSIAKRFS